MYKYQRELTTRKTKLKIKTSDTPKWDVKLRESTHCRHSISLQIDDAYSMVIGVSNIQRVPIKTNT